MAFDTDKSPNESLLSLAKEPRKGKPSKTENIQTITTNSSQTPQKKTVVLLSPTQRQSRGPGLTTLANW